MGGTLKIAEKSIEFRDTEAPLKATEGTGYTLGPEPLKAPSGSWNEDPNLSLFKGSDTDMMPGGTEFAPAGTVSYFGDFSKFTERLKDPVDHVTPSELYHAVEAGALRSLALAAPAFGGIAGALVVGLGVFSALATPGARRIFPPTGPSEAFLGAGSRVGFGVVSSEVMQPKQVKISEDAAGLKFENLGSATASNVWIGEQALHSETIVWKRLAPGAAYQPKGDGIVQIAVGPMALDAKGQPKDLSGSEHFGISGPVGDRRIFRME